jgi:ribose transport system substrate-binding protein
MLVMVGCAGSAEAIPSPHVDVSPPPMVFMEPTLLPEGLGTADDLVTGDDEISHARARLQAEEGFIMIMPATLNTAYHFAVARAARQRAEDLNLPVDMQPANTTLDRAIEIIMDATERGARVLILDVFDPGMLPALEHAAEEGVYVVQYAGRNAADLGAVTISIADRDLGQMAGTYAGQMIDADFGGRANVVILDFPESPQVVMRVEALREALLAAAPDAEIVDNYRGGTTEDGFAAMEQALADHPDIDVVVSINDAGAYGAYQVLSAAGRTRDDAAVIGIDGEAQARELIAEGTMYRATVDTAPEETGLMTVNAAIKMLAGSTVMQNFRVPVELITYQGDSGSP